MNYCEESVPYTRVTEHKYFAPWESHDSTVCYREFSRPCEPGDIPYYPVHLVHEDSMREHYMARARAEKNHLRGPARNLSLPGHGRDDPARARRGARVFKARRRLTKSRELGARLLPMWFCVYV